MKKVGLLLGSFDPIHIAHINIAACVLNSGLCDKVLFVVAKHNPWKKNAPASFDLRCKMAESSIEPFGNKCEVCRLEENIEPPTYSYKVLTMIREQHPDDELFIISGTDTFERLPGWKNFETDIKPYFKFIAIGRYIDPGHNLPEQGKAFRVTEFGCMLGQVKEIVPLTMIASSTVVRNMIKEGMNPTPYVTKEVLKIINDNNLYK
jgi:nicotinate-nucleotide adenylyltransferase